jgi:predicted nucleic acid-binding protein
MNKALLDTDIFSEILKERNAKVMAKAHDYFDQFEKFTISTLTVVEFFQGIYWDYEKHKSKEQKFFSILPDLEILALDYECGQLAGKIAGGLLKQGTPIGRCDPMIAAIAIHNSLTLVSGNIEHYQRITELGYSFLLENWKD